MKQFGFMRKYETICPEVKTFHEMLTLLKVSHQADFSSILELEIKPGAAKQQPL